jgi:hypothetical protein
VKDRQGLDRLLPICPPVQPAGYGLDTQVQCHLDAEFFKNFNRQFQLGEKEREAVEWGWNQEAGNTMFHVVNAYTRAAQFEGLPAEASYRLQKVGGAILGMVK